MRTSNPIVIILAVIGAIVVLGLVMRVAFDLVGLVVIVGIGVVIYLAMTRGKRIGGPR